MYDIIGTKLFPARSKSNDGVNPSIGVNYNILPNREAYTTFGTAFPTVDIFNIAGYSETAVAKVKDTVDVFIGNAKLKNQSSQRLRGKFTARGVGGKNS